MVNDCCIGNACPAKKKTLSHAQVCCQGKPQYRRLSIPWQRKGFSAMPDSLIAPFYCAGLRSRGLAVMLMAASRAAPRPRPGRQAARCCTAWAARCPSACVPRPPARA